MYSHINKKQENKSRAVASQVGQKKSKGKQYIGFVDKRPTRIAEGILQRMAKQQDTDKQAYGADNQAEKPPSRDSVIQRVIFINGPGVERLESSADTILKKHKPKGIEVTSEQKRYLFIMEKSSHEHFLQIGADQRAREDDWEALFWHIDFELKGLAGDYEVKRYVDKAVTNSKEKPDQEIEAFIEALKETLGRSYYPKAKLKYDNKTLYPLFNKTTWSIRVNKQAYIDPQTKKILDKDKVKLASNMYHEARHAEQVYRVARVLAGEGISAANISKTMKIPKWVAEIAAKNPLRATEAYDEAMIKETAAWREYFASNWYDQYYAHVVRQATDATKLLTLFDEAEEVERFIAQTQEVQQRMAKRVKEEIPVIEKKLQQSEAEATTDIGRNAWKTLKMIKEEQKKIDDIYKSTLDPKGPPAPYGLINLYLHKMHNLCYEANKADRTERDATSLGERVEKMMRKMLE